MKRVAVTGGAGFIGSHTVNRLAAAGMQVLVIDDQTHPCPEPPDVETLNVDCGSEEAAQALTRFQPDAVLHLASKGGVQVAARDPGAHVKRSLASTIALYDAAIRAGARRIVTASSGGTIYGDSKRLPARETFPAAPLSAYGAAKRSEEIYLAALGRRHGVALNRWPSIPKILRCGWTCCERANPHNTRAPGEIFLMLNRRYPHLEGRCSCLSKSGRHHRHRLRPSL